MLDEHAAALRIELGQDVVEEQERRIGPPCFDQLRLGEQEREDGGALLALGAERAQVAVSGGDRHVVQMRAEAGRPTVEVAIEPFLERSRGGRIALVGEPGAVQPERLAHPAKRRVQQLQRIHPGLDELGAEDGDLFGPRRDRIADRPLQGGIPLREGSRIVGRETAPRREQTG